MKSCVYVIAMCMVLLNGNLLYAKPSSQDAAVKSDAAGDSSTLEEGKTDVYESERAQDALLHQKRKEQEQLELENALSRARLEKEMADLYAEIERMRLEKEVMALRWELEQEKVQATHKQEIITLNQQREKLMAEVALAQAKLSCMLEKFNLTSVELRNKVALLKIEAEQLGAEIVQKKVRKEHGKYIDKAPVYTKEPLQGDGTLVLSDRCITLNGVINAWKATYVVDCIQYFNNKDQEHPIFIMIEHSPGGSIMAGMRILKAMENSQAPVHVVVKSFAASMASCITTLADKSYAYPNAQILNHYPWAFQHEPLNLREQKEYYEQMRAWWDRLGGAIAKKMGISLKNLEKKFYEKSARGNWVEFADNAKRLKWVDHIISGIRASDVLAMPDPADYTQAKYISQYFGFEAAAQSPESSVVYLPPLGYQDFYYLYNPDNRYQVRATQ
ncbi:MAG: ATP-dependent Clp protease proteolytic subunit [Bacteroidota bacterium]